TKADDFTYDKGTEHKLYREALSSLSKQHTLARELLLNFKVECIYILLSLIEISSRARVGSELDLILLIDLTIADEVTQHMKKYISSTTTRVTKRFLDRYETSPSKRLTKIKSSIENDKNETHIQEAIENNPFLASEDEKHESPCYTAEEQNEIQDAIKKLLEVDHSFAASMMRFSDVRTTNELRKILEETSFKDRNEPYD
ncbi:17530_t:CDS:2, partial [Entrophospora sp. SA101]